MTNPLELPSAKLLPPVLHPHVVQRPRLFERLDHAVAAAPLTTVVGFAGAGKSVLLSSWAAARPQRRTAWLSCDTGDTDPFRFWNGVVGAIRQVEPDVGADTLDRIDLDGRVSTGAIGVLSEELRSVTEPLVLVVDDLHKSADESLWPLLGIFVEWLPSTHRMILASRSEPSLPLHRWRVERRLEEIRNEHLSFAEDEAAAMLSELGATVDADGVALLSRRTEGWAAGLQLAGLSVRDRVDPGAYLSHIAATDSNIVDYLTDEVLDRLPEDLTQFLLAVSILTEIEPKVCRAITDDPDPQARLRDIAARSLFLVPLDGSRQRYRFHQLFAEMLESRLRVDEEHEHALHTRAAEHYTAQGDLDLAVYHSVKARTPFKAVTMMRNQLVRGYFSGGSFPAARLIAVLDDETLARERDLALEFALTIGMNGALEEAGRWLRRLDHLGDPGDAAPAAMFKGRLAAAHAFWEMARGGAERSTAYAVEARRWLAPDDDIARELTIAEARLLHYLDDLHGMRRLAEARPAVGLPPMASVIVLGAIGGIEADAGFLVSAERQARTALATADELGARRHYSAGEAMRIIGAAHVERLELDPAETLLEEATLTVEGERPGIELLCLLDQLWLLVERNRLDDALETLARAESLVDRVQPSVPLVARVQDAAVRLHLMTGAVGHATSALHGAPDDTRRMLGQARLALAQDRPAEARRTLAAVETDGWPRYDLAVALLQARTSAQLGAADREVDTHLEAALSIADEHGFVRSLLVDAVGLEDALARVLRTAPQGSHRDLLGEVLTTRVPVAREALRTEGWLNPSSRELEVLRYLATRLSNREIAAELYISLNTLKTHVRSIYRRLGVSSRTQAVVAARARGLL